MENNFIKIKKNNYIVNYKVKTIWKGEGKKEEKVKGLIKKKL